jgi:hypothetical protein
VCATYAILLDSYNLLNPFVTIDMTINAGPPLSYHTFRHGHMGGAGIVTPVACYDDDDDGTDEANRILNLAGTVVIIVGATQHRICSRDDKE